MTKSTIEHPKVVSREEWLAARLELLEAEKEYTRQSDEVARRRQELPWVRIEKQYRFETEEGSVSRRHPFPGARNFSSTTSCSGPTTRRAAPRRRSRMDPIDRDPPCRPRCEASAVLRAPLVKLQAYKQRMGWTFPWASSVGGDFNFDFTVSITKEQQREGDVEYNYTRWTRDRGGADSAAGRRDGGDVWDRRSTYARPAGHECVCAEGRHRLPHLLHLCAWTGRPRGMYQWLDRAPRGRNEKGAGAVTTSTHMFGRASASCRHSGKDHTWSMQRSG